MIVTAKTADVYGKVLRSGEEFDCPDKEAQLWRTLGRAKPVEEEGGERSRRNYRRRDMRAEA
ncbi:hypothetical protein [Bradyrhizobium sp. LA6.8]